MTTSPHHAVVDLVSAQSELSFTARIAGGEQRVWVRTDSSVMPTADAALSACLIPAMRFGGTLTLPASISPRVLRTQREFQAIQRAWSNSWTFPDFQLQEVEVVAPTRTLEAVRPKGRVAAFFSGGVDSWATILDEPGITDLIFVRGIDLVPTLPQHVELADEVEARLRSAAEGVELPLHVVETNLRDLSDAFAPWETYYGCAVVTVALFLAPLFERVLIAGDSDYEVQASFGANHMVDQLWSTESLEIVDAGSRYSRVQRVERIARHPVVQGSLRVCWENPGGAYNCGRCRKCLMTMVTLEALGCRDGVTTFRHELDLDAIAAIEINQPVLLTLWEDVLDATRSAGRIDLERPVAVAVEKAKRGLGLPAGYRRRNTPAPPPLDPATATPSTGATPDQTDPETTLAEVLASRSWRMTAPLRRLGSRLRRTRRR